MTERCTIGLWLGLPNCEYKCMVAQMKICNLVICTFEVENVFLQNSRILSLWPKLATLTLGLRNLQERPLYALQDKKKESHLENAISYH